MKKKIAALFLVTLAMVALTACGKFTCDLCGQEKGGKSHKTEILGQEAVLCDDCYTEMQELQNLLTGAL